MKTGPVCRENTKAMGNYLPIKEGHGMDVLIEALGRVITDRHTVHRLTGYFRNRVIGKGLRYEEEDYGLRLFENHGAGEMIGILFFQGIGIQNKDRSGYTDKDRKVQDHYRAFGHPV